MTDALLGACALEKGVNSSTGWANRGEENLVPFFST